MFLENIQSKILTLQGMERRPREVKWLAQGPTVRKISTPCPDRVLSTRPGNHIMGIVFENSS